LEVVVEKDVVEVLALRAGGVGGRGGNGGGRALWLNGFFATEIYEKNNTSVLVQ
jgi:hypothetical protein